MKKHYFILVLILFIAVVLRFWQLGNNPPSPDWDEVAIGYNAYSLLETGKDEYGTTFPLVFRSFDDYKPPLYFYLAMPAVKFFGLNVFAVRLPSALFGVLAVLGTYLLTMEVFRKRDVALLSSFLLAISPWHIYFSRIAFEANIGVALNILGAFFFLRAVRKNPWFLTISAAFFGLALFAYHSERIFVPFLVLGLLFTFRQKLWQIKKQVFVTFIVALIFILPLVHLLTQKESLQRFQGTSVYADKTNLLARSIAKIEADQTKGDRIGLLFDNRRVTYMVTFVSGYISHFSPRWLFLAGDQARHHAPDVGLLYLWEIPFILAGIFFLLSQKGWSKFFLFWWFLIAPIPAAPTTGTPHAVRTLTFLPTFQIFAALGVVFLWPYLTKIKARFLKFSIFIFTFLFSFVNFIYFTHIYFIDMPVEYSNSWQYGYRQAVDYVKENGSKYDKIVVSTKLEQPHMFFLFYLKYDPKKYLSEGGTASGGFAEWRNKFDKYEFRVIDWGKEKKDPRILYIGTPGEIPENATETIHYLDGTEAIRIAEK
ncbi:MAG: glycosyltransferase family 39 protein [bacterium]|nr:glycosyltransferase family 39 protein [bacterium]